MDFNGRPARRVKRFRVTGKISAAFVGPQTRCTANLRDISTHGCLLTLLDSDVKPGTIGRLGIQIGQETLRATAVAKRVVPGLGVGMEFSQMNPSDHNLLLRLIASASSGRPV
jgi:PilZ domain